MIRELQYFHVCSFNQVSLLWSLNVFYLPILIWLQQITGWQHAAHCDFVILFNPFCSISSFLLCFHCVTSTNKCWNLTLLLTSNLKSNFQSVFMFLWQKFISLLLSFIGFCLMSQLLNLLTIGDNFLVFICASGLVQPGGVPALPGPGWGGAAGGHQSRRHHAFAQGKTTGHTGRGRQQVLAHAH